MSSAEGKASRTTKTTLDQLYGRAPKEPEPLFKPKDVEKAVEQFDPAKHPELKGGEPGAGEPAAAAAGTAARVSLPDMIRDAMKLLKQRGIKGLRPSEYGTRLHAALDEVAASRAAAGELPATWDVLSNERLADIVQLPAEDASLTVREYIEKYGLRERFPGLPQKLLDADLGQIRPDILVRAPNGQKLVWDLTSQLSPQHLAKTEFYAYVIGEAEGGYFRISEDYWRDFVTE